MKGRTVCVIWKNDSFQRESLDKALMNGGVDVLRHFEKSIHLKEKVSIKRPWMEGWTSYVILKKLYMRFSVGSDFHITLDNMKFIQVNFIQSYREMKFGGNSQTCITL